MENQYTGLNTTHQFKHIPPTAFLLVNSKYMKKARKEANHETHLAIMFMQLTDKFNQLHNMLHSVINPLHLDGTQPVDQFFFSPENSGNNPMLAQLSGMTDTAEFFHVHAVLKNDPEAMKEYSTIFDFNEDITPSDELAAVEDKLYQISQFAKITSLFTEGDSTSLIYKFELKTEDTDYRFGRIVSGSFQINRCGDSHRAELIFPGVNVPNRKGFELYQLRHYKPAVEKVYAAAKQDVDEYNLGLDEPWLPYLKEKYVDPIAAQLLAIMAEYTEIVEKVEALNEAEPKSAQDRSIAFSDAMGSLRTPIDASFTNSDLSIFMSKRPVYNYAGVWNASQGNAVFAIRDLTDNTLGLVERSNPQVSINISDDKGGIYLIISDFLFITVDLSTKEAEVTYLRKMLSPFHFAYTEVIYRHMLTALNKAILTINENKEKKDE